MSRPTLGVLGGMGPAAGAEFLRLFVAAWPARRDQDHPRVVLLSDPSIPPRTAAILEGGADPTEAIRADLLTLCGWGADLLAVACNTAHVFIERFRDELPVPLVDIVAATLDRAQRRAPEGAWLAATAGTRASGLYQRAAAARGYRLDEPDQAAQDELGRVIAAVKAGDVPSAARRLRAVAGRLQAGRPVPLLCVCTELPLAYAHPEGPEDEPISSLAALAAACVRRLQRDSSLAGASG